MKNNADRHRHHISEEVQDSFRHDPLRYLILFFAAVIVCMSLIAPRHVVQVFEKPYPDTLGVQQ